jgi:hypothetical protein
LVLSRFFWDNSRFGFSNYLNQLGGSASSKYTAGFALLEAQNSCVL